MWKKPEEERPDLNSPSFTKSPIEQLKEKALVGPSIIVKGELSGEEDLMIQGRVEGRVDLKKNNVTVGRTGNVKANIYGKIISIEGEVEGDIYGEEKIIVRASGLVRGNMTAPRVNLEDGAKFKGSIDMDSKGGGKESTLKEAPVSPTSARSQVNPGPAPAEGPEKATPKSKEGHLSIKADTPRA